MNANTMLMREINLHMLRKMMKLHNFATKPQLAELTGLSVVTVNSLIKTLLENGEVFEDETVPSNGGRPAVTYRLNSEYALTLVIYMHEVEGKDTAFISIDNLLGKSIESEKKILQQIQLDDFDEIIEKYITKYPQIKAIICGMPGVEVNGRLIIMDYEYLLNKDFAEHIKNRFNLPIVFENDINAAVAGYCYSHTIHEDACVIGLYFPRNYPPGAGIFLNGKLYKGRDGIAGEIKYLPLDINWTEVRAESFPIREIAQKMILTVTSLYNPDQVVLYGEVFSESMVDEILLMCKKHIEDSLLPRIIVAKNFNEDFATGIRQIALKFLEPALIIPK
jgi:predicted NBD/HSP70 family sugar kinase